MPILVEGIGFPQLSVYIYVSYSWWPKNINVSIGTRTEIDYNKTTVTRVVTIYTCDSLDEHKWIVFLFNRSSNGIPSHGNKCVHHAPYGTHTISKHTFSVPAKGFLVLL